VKTDDVAELAQTLFEEIGDAAYIADPDTLRLLDVNLVAQRLTGLPRNELLRLDLGQLFRSDGDEGLAHLRQALALTRTFHSQEGYFLRRGRGAGWMPVNLTLTRLHTESRPLGLVLARDVTERHQAEERLRQANAELERRVQERTAELAQLNATLRGEVAEHKKVTEALRQAQQRLQQVVASSPAVLFTLAVHGGRIVGVSWISENLLELLGYPAAAAYDPAWWLGNIHPDDLEPLVAHVEDQLFATGWAAHEFRFRHRDGHYRWTRGEVRLVRDADGRPLEAVGWWSDTTERKQLEEQFRQAQKMEAVGRLAGGVAHDFNNLLTVIIGFSDLLLAELPATDPRHEVLAGIRQAGEQAARLTGRLLAFGRKAMVEPKVLDLNEVIDATWQVLRRVIGEDVTLTTGLSPGLSRVRIDPGQVEQVLLNLAVNARDAMPQGGRLTIRTDDVEIRPGDQGGGTDLKPGRHVRLAVADTGSGMTDEVKARLFEPFFTTKAIGRGTGLGLATVYGIVKQAGGHITVDTRLGVGTTFIVLLPAVAGAKAPALGPAPPPARGSETVLVAEDEDAVRRMSRMVLELEGYTVLDAGTGTEALRIAEGYSGPIHLLLTDVVMPDLGGRDLADAVRARRPEVKVLYMSGYTDDAVVRRGVSEAVDAFLQKPFTSLALTRKVRAVLDEAR
jgi:PAS domain S-box-containing protein